MPVYGITDVNNATRIIKLKMANIPMAILVPLEQIPE